MKKNHYMRVSEYSYLGENMKLSLVNKERNINPYLKKQSNNCLNKFKVISGGKLMNKIIQKQSNRMQLWPLIYILQIFIIYYLQHPKLHI